MSAWDGVATGSRQLDRTFAALAHPARRAILTRLASGPASATELGAPFPMSQPAVSKHLKVLEEAGLIVRGRHAQWRPCELRTEALHEVEQWMVGFRRRWEERLARLDAYLSQELEHDAHPEQPDQGQDADPKQDQADEPHHKEERHG